MIDKEYWQRLLLSKRCSVMESELQSSASISEPGKLPKEVISPR